MTRIFVPVNQIYQLDLEYVVCTFLAVSNSDEFIPKNLGATCYANSSLQARLLLSSRVRPLTHGYNWSRFGSVTLPFEMLSTNADLLKEVRTVLR